MGTFAHNEYTTGGVQTPRKNFEDTSGVEACSLETASTTTSANNPNINNVKPGSHNGK